MSDRFLPTHVVPDSGMRAWSEPDGSGPPAARLDPALDVQVIGHKGDWANVACSNGWTGWVDGRRLAVWTPPTPRSMLVTGIDVRGLSIVSLVGGVATALGSFLDWWSFRSFAATAWDIPIGFLLTGSASDGFKTGPILLVAAAVLAISPLMGRRLPSFVLLAVAAVALGLCGAAVIRGLREDPSIYPDVGLIVTMAGGALVASDGFSLWSRR